MGGIWEGDGCFFLLFFSVIFFLGLGAFFAQFLQVTYRHHLDGDAGSSW